VQQLLQQQSAAAAKHREQLQQVRAAAETELEDAKQVRACAVCYALQLLCCTIECNLALVCLLPAYLSNWHFKDAPVHDVLALPCLALPCLTTLCRPC
jgi:hypothetical protein